MPPRAALLTCAAVHKQHLIAAWAIVGVVAVLGSAVLRLLPNALAPLGPDLPIWAALGYLVSVVFMAYSEGYRGFQLAYSPRVVARAYAVASDGRPHLALLAPLVAMGLIHATRKRLIVSWTLVSGIVVLVILVRQLAQPWRGIVDAGVVVGLAWGIVAILVYWRRAAGGALPGVPADMPTQAAITSR